MTITNQHRNHCAVKPPSTGKAAPVIHPASSLARKMAAPATSWGAPTDPHGCKLSTWSAGARFSTTSARMAVLTTVDFAARWLVSLVQLRNTAC